jgi:biotin operon repressor/anti-sigma regulatory factor (Ser/Thr protein kinase)
MTRLTLSSDKVVIPKGGDLGAMVKVRARGEQVRKFILHEVGAHPQDIARVATDHFDISRQAVNKHLKRLTDEGVLVATGQNNGRKYRLAPIKEWQRLYTIDSSLAEDKAWRDLSPELGTLPENIMHIWQYAFTEMFNNAIDHSDGSLIVVFLTKTAVSTEIAIADNGVGIFRKIQAAMNLADPRHSVLELAKGKFTTDPDRHSGEGIFFTSRSLDTFSIVSGEVFFDHDHGDPEDWILERPAADNSNGTWVRMHLHNHTSRTLKSVFDQFSDVDFGFTKTVVPVKLARYGDDNLVSRSQAKRLLARVEVFRTVILDFSNVQTVGQGFADEIFRVFRRQHPDVELVPLHATPAVKSMISRAEMDLLSSEAAAIRASKSDPPGPTS